jgi:hypothetical protein
VADEITDPDHLARIVATLPQAPPPGPMHLFRLDVREMLHVALGDPPDHIVVSTWRAGEPVRRRERR